MKKDEQRTYNMKRFGAYILDWGIALALTGLGFWLLSVWRAPDLPDVAPDFTLKNLKGEEVSLQDYRGQTVILNFWAHWCGPCRSEIPAFRSFAKEHPEIPILGISVEGKSSEVKKYAKQLGIDYTVLVDDSRVQRLYNVSSLPTTVIVGPEGEVKKAHVGAMFQSQLEWATAF